MLQATRTCCGAGTGQLDRDPDVSLRVMPDLPVGTEIVHHLDD
jgi:hypothetical protein